VNATGRAFFTLGLLSGQLFLFVGCSEEASSGSHGNAAAAVTDPPNVLLVVIDTLRREHVSGYGYERETTPTLDRLLSEGVRFDHAIAHSSWSAPSHCSITTGTLPAKHRVFTWGDSLAEVAVPLAVPLREKGYRTGLFSAHRALSKGVEGIDAGMDEVVVKNRQKDDEVLESAAKWICKGSGRFLAQVILMTPHAPYIHYPEEMDSQYFADQPEGGDRTFPFAEEKWVGKGGIPVSVRIDDHNTVGYYVNRYDRGLRHLDALFDQFLEQLRSAGKLENTLLLVTSDHGESFGEHDYFAHEYQLYDTLIRVPLLLWYPGVVPAASVRQEQVQLIDLVPTVLAFTGIEHSAHHDGIEWRTALLSGAPLQERTAVASYRFRGERRFMVRTQRYKLIHDSVQNTEEVYDLQSDPGETRNLLSDSATPPESATLKSLRQEMANLLAIHDQVERNKGEDPLAEDVVRELQALGYVGDDPTELER
jgi:arylsulfatase A-like enzyme